MKWVIDPNRPVYLQLIDEIKRRIISGIYKPGDRLPSVRELAGEAAVNPNTMQRALSNLEQSGLVHSERTSGRFITEDGQLIERIKKDMVIEEIRSFLNKMENLGYDKQEIIRMIEKEGSSDE